ncbi:MULTISPECIES: FAD-binding domain-containing protein [Pontibacillus]|uniref:FAD-binding domain-containing protein n=1 Tax=Pontibacillus chungwhensis TaxID=265426 RepID=A0ABY8UYS4_9BACI|nr:FAD-binding domain-containing protein [Pontibacillus chungwhensis]MCD5325519.1 deoxyribodipyrimidine photo-lyase [Pontibacillus sp. HN14]WIF98629.1 FAD-binding domain-containing protein [Pontibacillus chungwhensis]
MLHVVWYKRDLRLHDHRPLQEAWREREPILPLYVAEPSIWQESELSIRHFQFVQESLQDLSEALNGIGGSLFVTVSEIEPVLETIYQSFGPFTLHAHEESGWPITYERNRQVREWMGKRELDFHEYSQFGIAREEESVRSFQTEWKAFVQQPVQEVPSLLTTVDEESLPSTFSTQLDPLHRFNVGGKRIRYGQQGGEKLAHETLDSFLEDRYRRYKEDRQHPLASTNACSRLSPYLAYGNLSMKYVAKRTEQAMEVCEDQEEKKELKAFYSNLQSRCRSIQWLKDGPDVVYGPLNSSFHQERVEMEGFERWATGQTGIPMIDAAMRALLKTGWLNERARAMLLSFACHTMGLDGKRSCEYLAGLFIDYEPGIHYKQVYSLLALEPGTKLRLYDPVREGKKHDSEGRFVRQYISTLKHVPNSFIHEPWKYDGFFHLDYCGPIVDVKKANRNVKLRWDEVENKGNSEAKGKKREATKAKDESEQITFDLFKE